MKIFLMIIMLLAGCAKHLSPPPTVHPSSPELELDLSFYVDEMCR